MNGKLKSELYSTLDYAKYFIKRWDFRLYLKASNEELVQREVGREFQTLGSEKQKEYMPDFSYLMHGLEKRATQANPRDKLRW